ncbi:MAG: alanine--tRNA ligase, partial [Alphaproteobacteria bacterium]|nr:alanine--tRNA ligase [Alphaproteobacteria bacterium]
LEETRFLQTLGRGLKLLEEETAKLPHGTKFSGDTAFKLYDTFGFPIDLTQDALRAKNIDVDMAAFDAALERQRADARKAWAGSGEVGDDKVWFDVQAQHQATEFLGYSTEDAEAVITTLVLSGQQVQNATGPSELDVLTNQTPFYAESGGQVGDEGWLQTEMGQTIFVKDTQKKLGKYFAHRVVLKDGEKLSVGDKLRMRVNHQRRNAIRAHHSATHLLHQALRERLGTHVAQQGSRVAHDRLRFDISQPVPPTPDDLRAVEYAVNERVQLNSEVTTRIMTPDEAIKLGAMALFGEKYGDEVRVVSMGGPVHDREYSIELCGGTHVTRTGDIGLFKIIGESAVAAGVRRIEAVTGQEALKYFQHQENLLQQVAAQLKVAVGDVPQRLDAVMDERRKLEREVADLRRQLALGGFGGVTATTTDTFSSKLA